MPVPVAIAMLYAFYRTENLEDAKQLGEEFYQKQRELMAQVVSESDVVITTAAIPGKKSPLLITADAKTTLLVSGTGEVLSPDDDVVDADFEEVKDKK